MLVSFFSSCEYVQRREQVKAATRAARKSEKQKRKSGNENTKMVIRKQPVLDHLSIWIIA